MSSSNSYQVNKSLRELQVFADEVAKADEPKASTGRLVAGTVAPGWHGLVAGTKGHKARAWGNEVGGGYAGGLPGYLTAAAGAVAAAKGKRALGTKLMIGGYAAGAGGAYTGTNLGTRRAQRMGHYKDQPLVKKSLADMGDVAKGLPSALRPRVGGALARGARQSPGVEARVQANILGRVAGRLQATGAKTGDAGLERKAASKLRMGQTERAMSRQRYPQSSKAEAADRARFGEPPRKMAPLNPDRLRNV